MAVDARDKEISINDHVRYTDTGTVGKVLAVKTEDDIDWVSIDKTGLWYKSKLVELLDEKDVTVNDVFKGKDINLDDLKQDTFDFQDMEMNSCNGGG